MDLYAYSQIGKFENLAALNEISVPRLRGYRLMSEEERLAEAEIAESCREHELYLCEKGCHTIPPFSTRSYMSEYSRRTDRISKKYLVRKSAVDIWEDGSQHHREETVGFRWNLLHGKKRKALKYAIRKGKKAARQQLRTFNKYVGREDVLYIHARIGGANWDNYGGSDLEKSSWFIEKVDDYFDSTYCDIYARISKNDVLPRDN